MMIEDDSKRIPPPVSRNFIKKNRQRSISTLMIDLHSSVCCSLFTSRLVL